MKRQIFTLSFAVFFLSLWMPSFAYPPDNAAIIYYKYMVNFARPDDSLWDQLTDAAKGNIEVNKEIQEYLEKKKQFIGALETASEIPNCDWGLDYSEGLSLEMSHLRGMRDFAYILLADAQFKRQEGRPQEAMDQCLVVLRMAGHVGKDTFIPYLIGVAASGLTYGVMEDILSSMPPDAAFLTKLQRELGLPEYNVLEIKTPLLNESRYVADEILRMSDKKKEMLKQLVCESEEIREDLPLLIEADPEFLRRSAEYYQNFFDQHMKILDQPYEKALQSFDALKDKPQEDYKAGKKEAFATTFLAPAVARIYSLSIRHRSHINALFTAIELYLIYGKEGSLPQKLPADAPKDLFSGRPFVYEITADGFLLRCNVKEQSKDQLWEYTFKIAR